MEQVTVKKGGERLDVVLASFFEPLSRRRARALCEQGLVRVNGIFERKAGRILSQGDTVELEHLPAPVQARPDKALKAGGPLSRIEVLYEDEHLLAIAKPAAMPSVTLHEEDEITAADCLAAYCPATISASKDARESGLVQRLDFYTSGALLAAKSPDVWQELHRQLIAGSVQKRYFALVEAALEKKHDIAAPLVQSRDGKKMTVAARDTALADEGPACHTFVTPCGSFSHAALGAEATLVQISCAHAKRHQIRVHLAHIGHPLAGDELYGSRFPGCALPDLSNGKTRKGFFLHAEQIDLLHPVTGRPLTVRASSSELDYLRKQVGG